MTTQNIRRIHGYTNLLVTIGMCPKMRKIARRRALMMFQEEGCRSAIYDLRASW
jgi:hypothetical protein